MSDSFFFGSGLFFHLRVHNNLAKFSTFLSISRISTFTKLLSIFSPFRRYASFDASKLILPSLYFYWVFSACAPRATHCFPLPVTPMNFYSSSVLISVHEHPRNRCNLLGNPQKTHLAPHTSPGMREHYRRPRRGLCTPSHPSAELSLFFYSS